MKTEKKLPKRFRIPHACTSKNQMMRMNTSGTSKIMPITAQPFRMRNIPKKKHAVPGNLSRREKKKCRARRGPINSTIPTKNSMLPSANKAESKKSKIPKNKNSNPNPVKPIPILTLLSPRSMGYISKLTPRDDEKTDSG
jgi:hypothetical protein